MDATLCLAASVGLQAACQNLGVSRATLYRRRPRLGPHRPPISPTPTLCPRTAPVRALTAPERSEVLDVIHEERFQDCAPAAIHATLLDEGRYLCSPRTMYRLLEQNGEVRERRDQRIHPPYQKPELLATAPNQLWSWDITKLRGPVKWTYFYLYAILDVFSRYVTGWMVAERESGDLAKHFLEETIRKYDIPPGQLHVHGDRGRPMIAKSVALMYADLGVSKSHSRPYVSDDNPYSESQFRTLKYRPDFPDRFGCIQDARAHCQIFIPWYNDEHRHSGIGMLTPAIVHFGLAEQVQAHRQVVLDSAYAAHPERFVRRPPTPLALPTEVWINRPPQPSPESDIH
jgi:putative transposase